MTRVDLIRLRCDRCNRQDTFNITSTLSSISEAGYHRLRIEPFADAISSAPHSLVSKELETYDLCNSCIKEFKDNFTVNKANFDDDIGIGSA
ncbi:MAG: hypothetical protein M3298_06710 [Thermoproteota archaeon]|nr:hypothetical protein [Thermoproteota archaeon]